MLEKHYRLKETATLLGISVGHLQHILWKEKFPFIRTNDEHRRISESVIEELLNVNKDYKNQWFHFYFYFQASTGGAFIKSDVKPDLFGVH